MNHANATGQEDFRSRPTLSVVIPTYKRSDSLRRSLESLRMQTFSSFEILVVDNADDPVTRDLVVGFSAIAPVTTHYFPEPRLGLHNARHEGARRARGDILVFTDDDATFADVWLESLAQAFHVHPRMVAAGGPVRPVWEEPPPAWLLDLIGPSRNFGALSLMQGSGHFTLSAHGGFFGVNMAIRRDVLFEAGGFNPESFGDIWLGDGETGLNRKLWNKGLLIGSVPEAVVHHHIPPSRMTRTYLEKRMANEGASTEYAHFRGSQPTPGELLLRRGRIGLSVARAVLVTPLRRVVRNDRSYRLKLSLDLAYNRSRFSYLRRLRRDEELRACVARKNWLDPRRA